MRRTSLSRVLPAALVAGALLALLVWGLSGLRPRAGDAPRGWDLRAGALEAVREGPGNGETPPGRFQARDGVELERAGSSLTLPPGSIVDFGADGAGGGAFPVGLPVVVEGSASYSSETPFSVNGIAVSPHGRARISLTPGEARVVEGRVIVGGSILGPGSILPSRSRLAQPEPKRESPEAETGIPEAEEQEPTGQVIDARSGAPLASVPVRATFSYQDDGYPPLDDPRSSVVLSTDAGGFFRVPPFREEDPRLKLHLQADHPDYLPGLQVVENGPDLRGRWSFTTLRLRRALNVPILFLDPAGSPLPGAAVEVSESVEDGFLGEDTWEEGRSFRPDRPPIFYSSEEGILRVPRQYLALTLRHPLFHLVDALPHRGLLGAEEAARLPDPRKTLMLDLRPASEPRLADDFRPAIRTEAGRPKEYLLQDQRGAPLVDSEVEIALRGMPPLRLFTDSRGAFTLAPRPYAREESESPLTPENPRSGTLTVLSPLLWKTSGPVAFPSRASLFRLEGRLGGTLAFRVGELDADQAFHAMAAEDLSISEDLTLVKRTAGGEALFAGLVPPAGTELWILFRGHLPESVRVPPHLPAETHLDLGDVALRKGGGLAITLSQGNARAYQRARLLIADRDRPALDQEYRPDAGGKVLASGLVEGQTYLYAIEGSHLARSEGEFLATEKLFQEGLTIPLASFEEVEVLLSGEVVGVRPQETPFYRVIERYFPERESDPLITLSYPLPPDGRIGSRRLLRPPRRAEAYVVGPGFRMGSGARSRPGADWTFDLGRIVPRESWHALFTFIIEGLGKTLPPENLSLFALKDRNREIARMTRAGRALTIEDLLPGGYVLRWGGEGGEEESFAFEISPGAIEAGAEIPRKAGLVETVEFRITDAEGRPVEGARVECSPHGSPPGRGDGTGTYLVMIAPREENRLRVSHPGFDGFPARSLRQLPGAPSFLPARVLLPAGAALPDPLVLLRGTRARALVKDAAGRRFEGRVEVSVLPQDPDPGDPAIPGPQARAVVTYGEPAVFAVSHGILDAGGLPPGRETLRFQAASSEAKAEGTFELSEKRVNDLGVLTLRETRSIGGLVYLPDGQPAAESLVGLVKPERAYRFPERAVDLTKAEYWGRSDALGRFRIDGLPLDLREELALVAHRDGYADAVLSPADLSAEDFSLVLLEETSLVIDVGYSGVTEAGPYQFRLQYFPDGEAPDPIDLGPLGGQRGGRVYQGISPGIYRVLWELKEGHPAIEPRIAAAEVVPGVPARLALRVDDRFVPGEAILNGEPLERGWVLLLPDPAQPRSLTAGRVRHGRFLVAVPLRVESALAALIPERDPLPAPDFYRGESLPQEIPDFRTQLRRRFLSVHYRGHDLTIVVPPEMLSRNPDLEIEFPHYSWSLGGYRRELAREPIGRTPFRLSLLPEGTFSLRISGRGISRLFQSIELHQDLTLNIGP